MSINDGMASTCSLQCINMSNFNLFKDLAKLYASFLMKQSIVADTSIEVFDRYDIDLYVKSCPRVRRAGSDAHKKVSNINGACPIPP